jgi:hypothetical protein
MKRRASDRRPHPLIDYRQIDPHLSRSALRCSDRAGPRRSLRFGHSLVDGQYSTRASDERLSKKAALSYGSSIELSTITLSDRITVT